MKFIEEKYRIVEFVSIFSFWKHFLEFFAGINFRGFELANIFVGSNFREFAEKPRKTRKLVFPRKLVPLRYSGYSKQTRNTEIHPYTTRPIILTFLQALIEESLMESHGTCEYALYVKGKFFKFFQLFWIKRWIFLQLSSLSSQQNISQFRLLILKQLETKSYHCLSY